jgi:hypothetical protein
LSLSPTGSTYLHYLIRIRPLARAPEDEASQRTAFALRQRAKARILREGHDILKSFQPLFRLFFSSSFLFFNSLNQSVLVLSFLFYFDALYD